MAAQSQKMMMSRMWTQLHMPNHAFLFHKVMTLHKYTIIYDVLCLYYLDVSAKLATFKGYILEIEKCVKPENNQVRQQLDHIDSLLNKAVHLCKASLASSTSRHPSKPLKTKAYIAPGQNLKQQPRAFSKTTLTPGRKKNGLALR